MKNLLVLLLAPSLLISMQLPIDSLSPRSREVAQQRAVINANRAEQQVFQDEAINSIIDLESEVWVLQQQVERLQGQSVTIHVPQMDAALLALNSQARLSNLQGEQIAALERTQQLQAQLQAGRDADLQQRIAAAEKSNYYLKWALGVSTAVTTTVFSVMGYLLWKNQQEQNNGNLITVSRDEKGKIIGFSQARAEAPYVAIPQPIATISQKQPQVSPQSVSLSAASQPAQAAVPPAAQPAQIVQQVPVQTPTAPSQPLPQYATREQLQAVNARIDEVSARIPQVARVMDKDGNIFLEYTDPGQQPRSGHSSYVGEFWPPKGFNAKLK